MDSRNWKKFAFLSGIIGCLISVILTAIAMFFYGGGSVINPSNPGFSFFENYLGDLLWKIAFSGMDNTISSVLASTGSILFGILLIPAFIASYGFFSKDSNEVPKIFAILGISFGILNTLGPIIRGISFGVVWLDLVFYEFYLPLIMILFLLLSFIFYILAFYLNKELPRNWTYILLITTIVFIVTALLNFQSNKVVIVTSANIFSYTHLAYLVLINYLMIKQLGS